MRKTIIIIFILSLIAAAGWTADLDRVGMGAGPIGMGKSGLALSDDINALFLNPAGLSSIRNLQLTSMYTNLLGEVGYIVAGGVYPLKFGTLGLSYTSARVSDIAVTTTLSDGSLDQNNISFVDYGSQIIALAYGFKIGPKNLGLSSGLNLKLYGEDFSEGSASGYDMDFGFRYQPLSWVRLAFVQKNFLPASLGASLNWNTGLKESIPTKSCLGVGLINKDYRIAMEFGAEKYILLENYPIQYKGGVEWWPMGIIGLRLGFDQEFDPAENAVGVGITNVLSGGVGFRTAGLQFDYAYRSSFGYAENNAHFFSISYIGKNDFNPPSIAHKFVNDEIYRGTKIKIGLKLSEKVRALKAVVPGGEEIYLKPNKKNLCLLEWDVLQDVSLGKHEILVLAEDFEGNQATHEIAFKVLSREPMLEVEGAQDRMVTSEEIMLFSGKAFGDRVTLNDEAVVLNAEGGFMVEAKLKPGVNKLLFLVIGEGGQEIEKRITILRELRGGETNEKS